MQLWLQIVVLLSFVGVLFLSFFAARAHVRRKLERHVHNTAAELAQWIKQGPTAPPPAPAWDGPPIVPPGPPPGQRNEKEIWSFGVPHPNASVESDVNDSAVLLFSWKGYDEAAERFWKVTGKLLRDGCFATPVERLELWVDGRRVQTVSLPITSRVYCDACYATIEYTREDSGVFDFPHRTWCERHEPDRIGRGKRNLIDSQDLAATEAYERQSRKEAERAAKRAAQRAAAAPTAPTAPEAVAPSSEAKAS
jgi:hypothetical protein